MSHILPGHNGLKNTVPLWIQPVSSYSLTGSCVRVSPGRRIAARGPSRDGQRLRGPQSSAEMLLPSIHPLLWLLLLLPGEPLRIPRGARGAAGRGNLGGPASRGAPKGTGWECHWKAEPPAQGWQESGCWGKCGFVRFTGFVWQCCNTKICFLVNEKSVSAEVFGVSGFCHTRVKVEYFNVQDIVFLKNTFYLHFLLLLI